MSPAVIATQLAPYKRAKVPFDLAWSEVAGAVPAGRPGASSTESVARATYRLMRAAYLNELPKGNLSPSLADGDGGGHRPSGKSLRLAA
jgi:hypothetical protein